MDSAWKASDIVTIATTIWNKSRNHSIFFENTNDFSTMKWKWSAEGCFHFWHQNSHYMNICITDNRWIWKIANDDEKITLISGPSTSLWQQSSHVAVVCCKMVLFTWSPIAAIIQSRPNPIPKWMKLINETFESSKVYRIKKRGIETLKIKFIQISISKKCKRL